MISHCARTLLDQQLRRDAPPGSPGTAVDRDDHLVRHRAAPAGGWSGVLWSALRPDTADAVIAAELPRFRAAPGSYEWKHYDHDQPADLPRRLRAAGLVAGEPEAVMVAAPRDVPQFPAPPGITLVDVTDDAGVEQAVRVHDEVFGGRHVALGERMADRLRRVPDTIGIVLAVADGAAVSAARIEYVPGTDFAGLWGGGTVPAWRGRGVYRALVSRRARAAEARGVTWLQIDASPQSEPVLGRLGFTRIATTTPYTLPG